MSLIHFSYWELCRNSLLCCNLTVCKKEMIVDWPLLILNDPRKSTTRHARITEVSLTVALKFSTCVCFCLWSVCTKANYWVDRKRLLSNGAEFWKMAVVFFFRKIWILSVSLKSLGHSETWVLLSKWQWAGRHCKGTQTYEGKNKISPDLERKSLTTGVLGTNFSPAEVLGRR